ncbi:MAG: hypothetical protein K8R74_15010, partial [Bacteroidales bacterium]|nr:hypothetical protein [Bacteroidales bacterium]
MKNIKTYKKEFLLILFISFFNLFAIGNIEEGEPFYTPSILPPSPTASELGMYGQIPVGLYTGTPNINIPLNTYKTKNLSLPISLSYNSNGIKVDQVASWVGMGWSLNAGGVITRIVRHQPDDKFERWNLDNIEELTPQVLTFLNNAWDETIDTEPDLFVFNFCGYTGKFFLNDDSEPIVIPYQDLIIDIVFSTQTDPTTITITTQEGIQYIFGGDNNCIESSKTAPSGSGCTKNYDVFIETAWYLKSITHPLGDIINFEYGSKLGSYLSGLNQTISKKIDVYGTGMCFDNFCDEGEIKTCGIYLNVKTVHLTKISSPNPIYGSLLFSSTSDRSDHFDVKLDNISIRNNMDEELKNIHLFYNYSYNDFWKFCNSIHDDNTELKYRMFLDSVIIKDKIGVGIEDYIFEYEDINGLPPRLSFSQDHWGYFNNAWNDYFVPVPEEDIYNVFTDIGGDRNPDGVVSVKGLLTKIIYPTGGYNILEYEPNVIWGSETIYPQQTTLIVDTTGYGFKTPVTTSASITLPYYQIVEIHASIEIDSSIWQYDPQHHQGSLTIFDIDASEYIYQDAQITLGNPIITSIDLEGEHQYSITVEAVGEPVTTTLLFKYYATDPQVNYDNFPSGGQRIKSVTSYDNIDEDNEIIHYYYSKMDDPDVSTGSLSGFPNYFSVQRSLMPCAEQGFWCDEFGCSYAVLHSNSQEQLFNYGSHHITYRWVTISYGENFENGGEEYNFHVSKDQYGQIIYGFHNIMGSTKSNQSWNNGLEKYNRKFIKFLSGEVVTVEETTTSYSYITETRNKEIANGIVVRKKYDPVCPQDVYVFCDGDNIKYYYNVRCTAQHEHYYIHRSLPGEECKGFHCIAPDANCADTIWHYCHGHDPEDTLTFYSSVEHFDVMRYEIYSYWNYIDTITTITYDNNGENPITNTTAYFYDNEDHALLSRTIIVDSNGDEIITKTYYPEDYDEGVANFEQIINDNFITALPIDKRTYRNDILINDKSTKYNDFGQAVEIYLAESELGTSHPFNPGDPYSFGVKRMNLEYSPDFNLNSYHAEDDKPTSFVWGYDYTFPLAKVENATFDEVELNLECTIAQLQDKTDAELMTIFSNLRTTLSDAFITS